MVDIPAALRWAGSTLGSPVATHQRMTGGLTSTMLALRHVDGTESVLRLMTNEPWRTHGAELTTRERDAQLTMADTPVPAPTYEPTFLHRDFSHRNLLVLDGVITGVVDWVETSTGPAWLDAAHAASNVAIAFGVGDAERFLAEYAELAAEPVDPYWLVMDAVGYLPPPGRPPMFSRPDQLERLDRWLDLTSSSSGSRRGTRPKN